jgi:hypothetical protein
LPPHAGQIGVGIPRKSPIASTLHTGQRAQQHAIPF